MDIVADVSLTCLGELGVVVQQVTLTNEGRTPSPPLVVLDAVYLPLRVFLRDAPHASGFGGGLMNGDYPPKAYREEYVAFGLGRAWEPRAPAITRWRNEQRCLVLSSGPEGRSSNPSLPLIEVGWEIDGGELGAWAGLEWSARWSLRMGKDVPEPHFALSGGPTVRGLALEPGESLRLPSVHVGTYGGAGKSRDDGLNGVRRHLDGFRSFRHLMMKDFYALTPSPRHPADWDVVQFHDPHTGEAVILAYRVRGDVGRQTIHPTRLSPDRTYQVVDPFTGQRLAAGSGRDLMADGIPILLEKESAAVRHLLVPAPGDD